MNPDPAYADTIIRAWLAEPVYFPPQDLDRIAALVHETPQRRSRWATPLWRSRSMFSAPKMITAAAIIGMAGWFLTAGLSSPSPDLAPIAAPSASPEASAAPPAAAIVLETPGIRLEADGIRLENGGTDFEVPAQPLLLEGVDTDTRWLTAAWVEDGVEQQLHLGLEADETDWWIVGVAAFDGTTAGDRFRFGGSDIWEETRTPLGETLAADLRLTIRGGKDPKSGKKPVLTIDGLRLSAFMSGTNPAPLTETCCRMLTHRDEVSIADLPDDVIEAHDRLVALGICHDFRYTYPVADPAFGDLVAAERWCTPPPVQEARSYTRAERKPRTRSGDVWKAGPYTVLADGSVRVNVEDEMARPHRTQPPAGWDCPTR
jgi:hypothetical protein